MSDLDTEAEVEVAHPHGFGIAYSEVMRDPLISMAAKALYAYLSTYSTGGGAWPAMRRMTAELAASRSSLKRYRDELVEHGYLEVRARKHPTGASTSSVHYLWVPSGGGPRVDPPRGPRVDRGGVHGWTGGGSTGGPPEGSTGGPPRSSQESKSARASDRKVGPTWTPDPPCSTCHNVHPDDPTCPPSQAERGDGRAEAMATMRASVAQARAKSKGAATAGPGAPPEVTP